MRCISHSGIRKKQVFSFDRVYSESEIEEPEPAPTNTLPPHLRGKGAISSADLFPEQQDSNKRCCWWCVIL